MTVLGLDTSGKYLNLALIRDGQTADAVHRECFKRQSEEILPELEKMMKRNGLAPADIDALVITEGPGSYTGIRIAMTLAKVWARTKEIPLYKISSLQFIAGMTEDAAVYMDARAHRGYFGHYRSGKPVMPDTVLREEDLPAFRDAHPKTVLRGDLSFIGGNDPQKDTPYHFAELKDLWERVDPVDPLVAKYLKDSSEYMVKK